jgi:hypothetical protein
MATLLQEEQLGSCFGVDMQYMAVFGIRLWIKSVRCTI